MKSLNAIFSAIILLVLQSCTTAPHNEIDQISKAFTGTIVDVHLVTGETLTLTISSVDEKYIHGESGKAIALDQIERVAMIEKTRGTPCKTLASWKKLECWGPHSL